MLVRRTFVRPIVTCLVILFLQNPIFASDVRDGACDAVNSGQFHTDYARDGQMHTYRVHSKGRLWNNTPFGHHAPGILSCNACVDGFAAEGMYYFGEYKQHFGPRNEERFPKTAEHRMQQSFEEFGYPTAQINRDTLTPIFHTNAIEHDDYRGYAVLSSVKLGEDYLETFRNAVPKKLHLFVLNLTDGCMVFDTVLWLTKAPISEVDFLNGILSDIQITKSVRPLPPKQDASTKASPLAQTVDKLIRALKSTAPRNVD